MTVRRNPITGDPVLFAPERAGRPYAFAGSGERGADDGHCPFCPGNERDTPPQILARGDPWRIRVFPNKYPPADGSEVIVESPRHGDSFADLENPGEVVDVWRTRLVAHAGSAYAALFRNEGTGAGASIPHLHSQLVPLPFVPPRIAAEEKGFGDVDRCPLCHLAEASLVEESESFRLVTPHAARMPWQQWLVPRRHAASMALLRDREIEDLGTLLRSSARATRQVAGAYNWTFMNFATGTAHFYVDVMPRVTTIGGLELGTGTFVEIVDPAAAARRLRH